MVMLADERRRRLLTAMAEAGIEELVLYGNAWQGDYLRYAADFGILEGHGIAVVTADGSTELFLDSASEAERAEAETPGVTVRFATDIARAVGARLDRVANHRLAAAPRRLLPNWLADKGRSFTLEDGTALLDRLLMHKLPGEIAVLRRAAQLADEAYAVFRAAVRPGRRQYELVADIEAFLRRRGCPDNFMIIGSGGKDVLGMTPPSERRIAAGDLVTTELTPSVEGYFVQICRTWWWARRTRRSAAPSRSIARRWRRASRRCGPAPRRPTWRAPRTTCFANTGSATMSPASGRGCAATGSGCSAIPSRTSSRTSTRRSFPAWR